MKIISRKEAKAAGVKTYFTGAPCVNGHVEVRSVANHCCYQCRRDNQNRHRAQNLDTDRESSRLWYAENKVYAAKRKRDWIASNREKYRETRVKWRSSPSSRAREMIATAKCSAKRKGIVFEIDRAWLLPKIEAGICEITGAPFDLSPLPEGRQNPYTASLDRIRPELGYAKSNVRVILWGLNAAFNSYGEGVYADIARLYLTVRPNSTAGLT